MQGHRRTRVTGPGCVVMCNLMNIYTHTQHTRRTIISHPLLNPPPGPGSIPSLEQSTVGCYFIEIHSPSERELADYISD